MQLMKKCIKSETYSIVKIIQLRFVSVSFDFKVLHKLPF